MDGRALERAAVITMQHPRRVQDAFTPPPETARRAGLFHEIPGLCTILNLMHFPTDDLAAVQINDQVQEVKLSADRPRQPSDVTTPHLIRLVGAVCGGRARC